MDGRDPELRASILQTLSHRQDLLPCIHKLYVHHTYHQETSLTADVDQLVPHLHHLRLLHVEGAMITPTISQFIHAAQSLREVFLGACQWPEDIPNSPSPASPSDGQFTNISISTTQDASLLIPTVTTLFLFIETVQDIIPFLDRGVYSVNGVVDLKIEGWNTALMQRLFAHLPNLKKLHVTDSHQQRVPQISFDGGGLLPQLQSMHGWSKLADAFEGRSEIQDLTLDFYDHEYWHKEHSSTFNKVFPKLKTLSLRRFSCLPNTINSLSVQYPGLVRLEIDGDFSLSTMAWLQERLHAGTLGTLPQLEVLRLTNLWGQSPDGFQVEVWCSLPLTAQMKTEVELLDAVKQRHCPKLCEARISWGRTWCHDMDGWIPVIRPVV